MNNEPVKKINVPYLLSYIFIPALVTALCFWLGYTFFHDGGTGAVILFMVPSALSLLWWIFGGKLIFKGKRKKLMKELDSDKGIGLIESVRQGLGKPNIIYVKNFVGGS